MPRIPYEPYSTATPIAGTGAGPVRIDAQPAAFGVNVAEAFSHFGQVVEGAGNEIYQRGMAVQELKGRTDADAAVTKYSDKHSMLVADALAKQGKSAYDAIDPYSKASNDLRDEIGKELADNPFAQRLYDSETRGIRNRGVTQVATWGAHQLRQYNQDTAKAKVDMYKQQANDFPDDDAGFKQATQNASDTAAQAAIDRDNSLTPDSPYVQMIRGQAESQMVASRIEGMVPKNAPLAKQMLDKALADHTLRVEDANRIESKVLGKFREVSSRVEADALIADYAPYMSQGHMDRMEGVSKTMSDIVKLAQRNHPEHEYVPGAMAQARLEHPELYKQGNAIDMVPMINGKEDLKSHEGQLAEAEMTKDFIEAAGQLGVHLSTGAPGSGHYYVESMSRGQMAVLDAIAHGEAEPAWVGGKRGGYGTTVMQEHFDPGDYTDRHPFESGKFQPYRYPDGRISTASGRYQEVQSTYKENVAKYGIKGFSEGAQDQRAWLKAADLYKDNNTWKNYKGPNGERATGDLQADVEKFGNDPEFWFTVAGALKHEWTSVPGGSQPNDKTRNWIENAISQFREGIPSSTQTANPLPPETLPEKQSRLTKFRMHRYGEDPIGTNMAESRMVTEYNYNQKNIHDQYLKDRNILIHDINTNLPNGNLPTHIEELLGNKAFADAWERLTDEKQKQYFLNNLEENARGPRYWSDAATKRDNELELMKHYEPDKWLNVDYSQEKVFPQKYRSQKGDEQIRYNVAQEQDPRMHKYMSDSSYLLGQFDITQKGTPDEWNHIQARLQDAIRDFQFDFKKPPKQEDVERMVRGLLTTSLTGTSAIREFFRWPGQTWAPFGLDKPQPQSKVGEYFYKQTVPDEAIQEIQRKFGPNLDENQIQQIWTRFKYRELFGEGVESGMPVVRGRGGRAKFGVPAPEPTTAPKPDEGPEEDSGE